MAFQAVVTRFMTSRMLILREDGLPGRHKTAEKSRLGHSKFLGRSCPPKDGFSCDSHQSTICV